MQAITKAKLGSQGRLQHGGSGGEGDKIPLLTEDVRVFFLYSVYNEYSQNCIFRPSENPTIINFPMGPPWVGPLLDTGYKRIA